MFSLLLDQILDQSEEDINTYSDYTLAKQLGVTPSKINSLKLKKQLQYPYESFNWKVSFQRCCKNARLDGGKIKINLRDVNLYYELKNQVEIMGGFAETSLTRNLLVISPEDFFKLTEELMTETERTTLENAIRMANSSNKDFLADLEKESFPSAMKRQLGSEIIDVLFDVLKGLSPGIVGSGISLLKTAIFAVINNR